MKKIFWIIIFFFVCHDQSIPINKDIAADDIYSHISFLASDKLEGRKAGSSFENTTAQYVKRCFKTYGLTPVGDNYIQKFDFIAGMTVGDGNFIEAEEKIPKSDFTTLSFSSSEKCTASLVFAGYGISATDIHYDDYENLEVKGKIVVVIRYSPDGTIQNGKFAQYNSLRYKAMVAREKGAAGIIFITGGLEDNNDDKLKTGGSLGGKQSVGIPAVHLKRRVMNDWLTSSENPSIEELQNKINGHEDPHPASFEIGKTVTIRTNINPESLESCNVVGSLPGVGAFKNEWVILGAHMDHLGWGGESSNTMVPDVHEIHNGADDNASGIATLLELAAYFAKDKNNSPYRRSLLFIAFGAEEVGLLGSAYFVEHPLIPLDSAVAMFNFDMVGRLRENSMVIGGTGTSPAWETLLINVNSDSIHFTFDDEGFGSSDHQSFYLKNIPVLFFFTGAHEDYHKPTDDIELLNIKGMEKVAKLAARSTLHVLTEEKKPGFVKVESKKHSERRGYNVTFGVVPDFVYNGDGFKISGVRDKAPAGLAGMQAGDIIMSINNITTLNIHDYMFALQSCTAGVEVPVVITRNNVAMELKIAPQGKDE